MEFVCPARSCRIAFQGARGFGNFAIGEFHDIGYLSPFVFSRFVREGVLESAGVGVEGGGLDAQ